MKNKTHDGAHSRALRFGLTALALSVVCPALQAADYYLDPVNGSASNPGTQALPWPSMQEVFANTTLRGLIQSGDVLLLADGYHGLPLVEGFRDPANPVTIRPIDGASPKIGKLEIRRARGWVIDGLDICPENAGAGQYSTATLALIEDNSPWQPASDITIKNCTLRSVFSIDGYVADDWYARVGKGIQVAAPRVSLINNHIENVNYAIIVSKNAPNAYVSGNFVKAFSYDAIRGLSNDSVYEFNWVQDSYVKDSNHDDFFQSWSQDGEPVYRITIRNNVFISRTDPNQPLYSAPQGVGCFDGFYDSWVVENNVIMSDTYHGISIYGGINCRVVNNTVLTSPYPASPSSPQPWVKFFAHKNGTLGYGNILRNNMASNGTSVAGQGVSSNNLTVTDYSGFVDYEGFDVRLRASSPAVDAGTSTDAPEFDIEGNPRVNETDIGAYEYQRPLVYEGFDYAPTNAVNSAPDSPSDIGLLGTTWGGTNDIVSPGLSFGALPQIGNALKVASNVGSERGIDMSVFPDEYKVTSSDSVVRLGASGSTLWLAFLMRADGADSDGTLAAGLNLLGAATGGTVKLAIGDTGSNANWGVKKGSTVASSTTPITQGDTVLLVARLSFVAGVNNDEVDLFVNPTIGATPPSTPDAMLRGLDIGSFEKVEFKGSRTSTMDELVIVTDWDDL